MKCHKCVYCIYKTSATFKKIYSHILRKVIIRHKRFSGVWAIFIAWSGCTEPGCIQFMEIHLSCIQIKREQAPGSKSGSSVIFKLLHFQPGQSPKFLGPLPTISKWHCPRDCYRPLRDTGGTGAHATQWSHSAEVTCSMFWDGETSCLSEGGTSPPPWPLASLSSWF